MELYGKAVPGIMKLRKSAKEKKEKELKRDEALKAATKALEEFTSHYDPERIKTRDIWMHGVDEYRNESCADRESIHEELASLSSKLDKNNEITLAL